MENELASRVNLPRPLEGVPIVYLGGLRHMGKTSQLPWRVLSSKNRGLYMKETMIRQRRDSSEPGGGLGNPGSRIGRVCSVKLGDDLGGVSKLSR